MRFKQFFFWYAHVHVLCTTICQKTTGQIGHFLDCDKIDDSSKLFMSKACRNFVEEKKKKQ